MYKGIDVSRYQGNIDYKKVKASGIDFVIIKAGGSDAPTPYTDKFFLQNVINAASAGLHIGAYYFVGKNCKSAEAGLYDAMRFERLLSGKVFDYPVYIDFEAPDSSNKQGNTNACIAFCEYLETCGYYVGIYGSDISGFKDKLYLDQLKPYDKWVARYGSAPKYVEKWGIWQERSNGNVPGISGHVDIDYSRNNYSDIIIKNHLNGFM